MTDSQPSNVPAEESPAPHAGTEAQPGPRRINRKPLVIAGAVVVLVALIAGVVIAISQPTAIERTADACAGTKPYDAFIDSFETPAPADSAEGGEYVRTVFDGVVTVEDDGKTLIVSTKPQDDDPLGLSSLVLDCIYEELGTPKRVSELIGATRSLDGRQTGDWANFDASWSYHPDNGLNLIISQG